jgi:hypothetical protein
MNHATRLVARIGLGNVQFGVWGGPQKGHRYVVELETSCTPENPLGAISLS